MENHIEMNCQSKPYNYGKIKDTIPPEIKQCYFTDRVKPNLLEDYDVIGFDVDHCLVKYNVKE